MSKVVSKIKKLLAIAEDDHASDNEIEICLTQVRKLMDKHQLSEDDLVVEPADQKAEIDAAEFGEWPIYVGKKVYNWEAQLSMVVADICGVKVYRDTGGPYTVTGFNQIVKLDAKGNPLKGRRLYYYGVAEDCAIAVSMFYDLRELIATMAFARYAAVYKGDGGVYSEGFVTGIRQQFAREHEQERQLAITEQNNTALILADRRADLIQYKKDKASDWLTKNKNWKLRKSSGSSGASGSADAFKQGRSDGSNTDVSFSRMRKLT